MGDGGGGWYSPIKVTGVLIRKFRELTPYRVPKSCFMGMSVADNFLTWLIFIFLFFLVMTMYANEFQTKGKQKLTEKKNINCNMSQIHFHP